MRLILLHRRPAKAQASLRIRAVSPEPPLFAYIKYGSRRRFRPKINHVSPLDGCPCAFEEWVYGGQKIPYSYAHVASIAKHRLHSNYMHFTIRWCHITNTPSNVLRGNKKLCKWNSHGNTRPWLTDWQSVKRQVIMFKVFYFLSNFAVRYSGIGRCGSECISFLHHTK